MTTRELSLLSRQITPQGMRTIAREYLDFEPSEIETLDYSCRHNKSEFKFQILHIWKNKHMDNNWEVSSPTDVKVSLSLPSETKLQQGNVFTPVCHSVHRGGVCLSACWDTHTPLEAPPPHPLEAPPRSTPTEAHTPLEAHPPGSTPSPRRSLQRTVRILLECFLVKAISSCLHAGSLDIFLYERSW